MSSERLKRMFADLMEEIGEREQQVVPLKRMANDLASQLGEEPPFALDSSSPRVSGRIAPDAFASFSAPSPAARKFLEMRKAAGGGAATVDEIFDALFQGGYPFDGDNKAVLKGGVKIALAKDKQVEMLPNGHYGLRSWYGRRDRKLRGEGAPEEPASDTDAAPPEAESDESQS
jgi:hypothetical protein